MAHARDQKRCPALCVEHWAQFVHTRASERVCGSGLVSSPSANPHPYPGWVERTLGAQSGSAMEATGAVSVAMQVDTQMQCVNAVCIRKGLDYFLIRAGAGPHMNCVNHKIDAAER